MRNIILVGGGGHAAVVAEICKLNGYSVEGYVALSENKSLDYSWLGDDYFLTKENIQNYAVVVAIGEQATRARIFKSLLNMQAYLPSLVHPSAIVSSAVKLGSGTVICAGAVINVATCIGSNCIINTGAKVDHDCIIQNHVHIGPGSVLCGEVSCDDNSFVGAGSVVIQSIEIGCSTTIGAGSLVIHNIPPNTLAYGVPCKVKECLVVHENV